MNAFSAGELARMRGTQNGAMMDLGYIQVHSRTFNSFSEAVDTYTDAANPTICGLDMRPGSERSDNEKTLTQYDATVRLPITTTVTEKDRFKVVRRFGETLTAPLVFSIASPIQRGPSGIRLLLNRVET